MSHTSLWFRSAGLTYHDLPLLLCLEYVICNNGNRW
jgi:hypothetical protein